jgi:hypothetical protein
MSLISFEIRKLTVYRSQLGIYIYAGIIVVTLIQTRMEEFSATQGIQGKIVKF